MLQTLKLLLPAVIPSWRFFDTIAPSPRIEIALLKDRNGEAESWQEFRPRPKTRTPAEILKSLFWNPARNESLFLTSCAERLMQGEEDFARPEIFRRIKRQVRAKGFVQFRLIFHARVSEAVERHTVYVSPVEPLGERRV